MPTTSSTRWGSRLLALTACTTLALTACGGSSDTGAGGSTGGSASATSLTLWDPYPQFDETADWSKLVQKCGTDAGVTITRNGYDTTDLTNKAILAAQQGQSPNVLVVDNPVVSTLAEAGILSTTDDLGLDTSGYEANILAAGQMSGKTYGVPIGANTLALYYNEAVLTKAGVDPASITDWTSLTAALAKVTAAGSKGITFSAIGTEEGSFQFLPWFWGGGGDLTELNSADGVASLTLWKDWLDKGYAPNSVINNTQTTSWQEFETGDYAFGENGTWQLANAAESGLDWGVISIPSRAGGGAPAPTGGEFVTVPTQKDTAKDAAATKVVECLTSADNAYTTDTTLSYVGATAAVQEKQAAASPELEPWITAVKAAKGRTSDDLGTKYPVISQEMWKGVQAALSGSQTPQQAMDQAQQAASAAG